MSVDIGERPCMVIGDEHLLGRAIENVLDNAIRHTPHEGEIQVLCAHRQKSGEIRFQVRDTGPGIPEANLDHVFESLFRGEDSQSRSTGGSGLGLAIARRTLPGRAESGEGGSNGADV